MRYEELKNDAEREIWRAEIEATRGLAGAEGLAAHAIEVHRDCHSGPMEAAKDRRRSTKIARGSLISDADLMSLADRCNAEALIAVPELPPGSHGRQHQDRKKRINAFATLAMQVLVGTALASRAMGISEQGTRDQVWCLRRDHRELTAKAEAFVEGIREELQRRHEGKAA